MNTKSQIIGSIVIVAAVFSVLLLPTWQQPQANRLASNEEVAASSVKTAAEASEITEEAESVADADKPAEDPVEESGTSESAKTIAYQDSYRTVVTFNPAQIQKVTGLQVEEASIEKIVTTFQQEDTWTALDFSADDAKLIAGAASSEANTIRNTVKKLIKKQATDLNLVVFHSKHRNTAHFGTNNG